MTGRAKPIQRRSIDLDPAPELLILVADELDRFLVHCYPLIDTDGERLRISLRIRDRHVNFKLAKNRPAEAFGELRLATVRTAANVQPAVELGLLGSAEIVRFDNQRIAFPAAH